MATGGASELAGPAGLPGLAVPLLGLAVAQAVAIAALVGWRRHRTGRADHIPGGGRFGQFTVPLGLAVVGVGLAGVGTLPAAAGGAVCLAWAATVYLACMVAVPVIAHRLRLEEVGGAWFLAPAALLGDAIGLTVLIPAAPGTTRQVLGWVAVAACCAGFCGYWLIVALAGARCARFGAGPDGRAAWWISAGCGGLVAAAAGDVQPVVSNIITTGWFAWPALAAWAAGTVLLIPVLAASITHLAHLAGRRYATWAAPVWPPTFSTAVYALGAIQTGRLTHLHTITHVVNGTAAAGATAALWLATTALWLAHTAWRTRRRILAARQTPRADHTLDRPPAP